MSHYDYLNRVMPDVCEKAQIRGGWEWNCGLVSAHGDKGYSYRDYWKENGIPFPKGMAIFLLSYCHPYADEVRETDHGWVDVKQWVVDNYTRFESILPEILPEDNC